MSACILAILISAGALERAARAQTPRSADPLADGGAVPPDIGGRITELLLYYDPTMQTELAPLYRDLFRSLGNDLLLRVITPDSAASLDFAERWAPAALGEGREVEVVSVGMPLTIWARDRCIARQSRSLLRRATSFVPADERGNPEEKRNDRMVQALLSLAGMLPGIYSSPLQLEGGNVVANTRHVFVGANVIDDNRALHQSGRLPAELRRLFGRPYILVGGPNGQTPWCHVDMYLTPIDDRTVLVGSPALGERLLMQAAAAGDATSALLLGDREACADLEPLFEAAVESVRSRGYRVLRSPVVVDRAGDWMITYNNVLLERRGGKRVAYVPTYRVPVLDAAAEGLYAELGFEVHAIDVTGVFALGGALRCVANVTERVPDQSRLSRHPQVREKAEQPTARGITLINLSNNLLFDADDCADDADWSDNFEPRGGLHSAGG